MRPGPPQRTLWNARRLTAYGTALAVAACDPEDCAGSHDAVLPGCVFSSIAIVPAATSVEVGQTAQLSATVVGNGPCNPYVTTFSSLNPAIATIDPSGLVKGITVGGPIPAHLQVVGKDPVQANTTAATVTVVPPTVATLAVNPLAASVLVGQTQLFTATTTSIGGISPVPGITVTWNSATPLVASVDANGLAKALAPGVAIIQALAPGTSGQKVTNATLNVGQAGATTVTVTPAPTSVPVGSTVQLNAVVKDGGGNTLTNRRVTWVSDNPLIARVVVNAADTSTRSATVTGITPGSSTDVRAIADENQTIRGSSVVTVTPVAVGTSCTIFGDDFTAGNPFVSSIFTGSAGVTQSVTGVATGGNPGAYVQYTHSMPTNSSVTIDYMFPGTYSAALLGAVAFIDYHEDRIELTATFLDDGGGLLVRQGTTRIEVPLSTNPLPLAWTRVQRLNIRPADIPGLNFTAGGAPIQFGFYRTNSNDPTDPPMVGRYGLDNFEVKVCR